MKIFIIIFKWSEMELLPPISIKGNDDRQRFIYLWMLLVNNILKGLIIVKKKFIYIFKIK